MSVFVVKVKPCVTTVQNTVGNITGVLLRFFKDECGLPQYSIRGVMGQNVSMANVAAGVIPSQNSL